MRLEGSVAAGQGHIRQRRRRVDGREQLAQVLEVVVPLQVERLVADDTLHSAHSSETHTQNTKTNSSHQGLNYPHKPTSASTAT